MIRDVDYDRREREGEAREADETARWMVRMTRLDAAGRLHTVPPVEREAYLNNLARWSS